MSFDRFTTQDLTHSKAGGHRPPLHPNISFPPLPFSGLICATLEGAVPAKNDAIVGVLELRPLKLRVSWNSAS
jgi:hypothetical protein